jgi:small conductance mechanosensitive channel
MNMLSTTVRTFDNKLMIVPNGKIGGDTITNATASDTRRIDMTFGIGYGDDVDQAQSILERIVTGHPLVLKDPAPLIRMNELADSSVNFIVRPWSKTGDYWTIYWEVMAAVKREFTAAGISIPYPQQDVHVHQVTA